MGPRDGALVRMVVRLVVPSAGGPQASLTFEIWRHLYAPPLFPRQREVFVRESIGEAATEIEMVDARPADRTHAHRARRDVDVDLAPLSMRARSDTKSGEPGGRAIISRTVPA
jgi:hypothetical protein